MKKSKNEDTVGKHPIPHAKGVAKNETSDLGNKKKKVTT